MRRGRLALVLGAAATLAAGAATAAPTLQIRRAAVNVVVIPEARPDIAVTVLSTNRRLPIYVTRVGDRVLVDGRLLFFMTSCRGEGDRLRIGVFGKGSFAAADLPRIVVRTPLDVFVDSEGAAVGAIGRSGSVHLHHGGCGRWTVANVEHELSLQDSGTGVIEAGSSGSADIVLSGAGRMSAGPVRDALSARVSGSGLITVASAGAADLVISGSGDVKSGPVTSGLEATISGSGSLDVARLQGPFKARVSGVGQIRVPQGEVTRMEARISGSGGVSFGGVAQSLDAVVSGVGDVRVGKVTGSVSKTVSGAGQVVVGP